MSVKGKISYVWNVILGPDYTDEVDIKKSDDPEMKDLKDSLERVEKLEQGLKASTSNKAGKGNSSKIVEKIKVDNSKAIKVAEKKQQEQSVEKELEGR